MSARTSIRIPLILMLVAGTVAFGDAHPARDEPADESTQSDEATGETRPTYEEHVEVLADRPIVETVPLDLEILDVGRVPNIGVAASDIAGVSGVRRSLNSYEPVVRGLGWERVQTQVNGMPIYGACPARMDPPAFMVAPSSARAVSVVKGLASVTLGPAGTGGRVEISTDYDRGLGAGRETDAWVDTSYGDAGNAVRGTAGVKGGTRSIDYSVGIEAFDQGDYESADGTVVPASQTDTGGFLSVGHRPTDAQRWFLSGVYQEGEEIAYPSLPMDADFVKTTIYSGGYRYQPTRDGATLSSLEVSLGTSTVDHLMSNRFRTNRQMMQAATTSDSNTDSVALATRWRAGSKSIVEGGADFNTLKRDALRQRHVTAVDRTFSDHMWPDTSQDDLGLFAEYAYTPNPGWQLRVGARYDDVRSEAAAADDPALGGGTIREAYVRFYGPEAAVTDRDESIVTGNVVFSTSLSDVVTLQGGVGLVSRAAGVTERYFAFALSPNGFLVGNPALDAERKREVSLGAIFEGKAWSGSVSGYYYSIADYILPVVLTRVDVDGNGSLDLVRGFENTDATLTGIDMSFEFRPAARWTLPTSLFYVRGVDDTRNVPLPEIPPLELRVAGRWSFPTRRSGWVELGGRFVSEQDRVDPDFPEDESPSFTVWHLRGRYTIARFVTLQAGVENLLDENYWEHLTREAAGNLPGFDRGDEIPQPGRYFTVALIFAF